MRYMLLICGGGESSAEPTGAETPIETWVGDLGARGVRLHGNRLSEPDRATTVRVRGGETLLSDGPFAETKEFIAGYDVIEADSLQEAIAAAAWHPVASSGAVEVRPFHEDEPNGKEQIARLQTEITEALLAKDLDRLVAQYAPDVEVYDAMGELGSQGREAFRKAQEAWFAGIDGPIRREVSEPRLRVDGGAGFGHALNRLSARLKSGEPLELTLRVSNGYGTYGDDDWLIAHQHISAAQPKES